MSRVTLHRWRRRAPTPDELQDPDEPPEELLRRSISSRGRRWLFLMFLAVLAATAWLLPGLVAHTQLLDYLVETLTPEVNGKVTVRSASLAWLRPVVVEGIEIRDAENKPVLLAERLASSSPLAEILWNWPNLGKIRLEKPHLNVVMRNDGSNVEDLLAGYLQPTGESSGRMGIELTAVDGSLTLGDQNAEKTWQIDDLELVLKLPADGSKPIELDASATVAEPGDSADSADPAGCGRLAATLCIKRPPARADSPAFSGEADVTTEAVRLEMFDSLLERFLPKSVLEKGATGSLSASAGRETARIDTGGQAARGTPNVPNGPLQTRTKTRLSGLLSARIQARWGEQLVLRADVTAEQLALATPALGTDKLLLERLHLDCGISRLDGRLEIAPSSLECDLGNLSASGVIDLGGKSVAGIAQDALRRPCEVTGRVDLARLAGMLPDTLRIRRETKITSGELQLALFGRRDPQGPDPDNLTWQGRLEARNLHAVDRGRELSWRQPILLTLLAHDTLRGPVVEQLKCVSDFLQLHAAGTPDNLVASASFDLGRLADQLGQFVDLDHWRPAGDGWAHLNWKSHQRRQFETELELQVRDLKLTLAEGKTWREENLVLLASAAGGTDPQKDIRLDSASADAQIGGDRIRAWLSRPVPSLRHSGGWPLEVKMLGRLQDWTTRLKGFAALDDWAPAGQYDLSLQATGSADGLTVRRARLAVVGLKLAGHGLCVEEPNAELKLSGGWDRKRRRLHLEPASLDAGSLSIDVPHLALALPAKQPPELSGNLTCRGDLEQLNRWFADSVNPLRWRMAGQLVATAQFQQKGTALDAVLETRIENLTMTDVSGKSLRQPKVHLVARGTYDHPTRLVRLDQLRLNSDMLGADLQGKITRPAEQTQVQLDGRLEYDLAQLAGLLRPYLVPKQWLSRGDLDSRQVFSLSGKGSGPVSYHGPLSAEQARANAVMRWDWANLYGFQAGPGELQIAMADGILSVQPLSLAVSGGRLLLEPRLRLGTQPAELILPAGPLAEQVQITPQMCDLWLKYVAPVLAGVTSAQGTFSVDMEECRIPLADPARSDLSGRFIIHSVQIGPGPLIRELAGLLGYATPAKLRQESAVPFEMVDGRVYHSNLELTFPDLTVRTSGSVGLDKTLAIVAEMPIPPKWLGKNVLGNALKDQTVRIPIRGTLSRPQLDRRVLARFNQQLFKDAAKNVLEEELQKGLKRLFGPPR